MPGCRTWQEAHGSGSQINRDSPQASGLLLLWPAETIGGSSYGNVPLTRNGLTLQAAGMRSIGAFGRELQFDGSSKYATSQNIDWSFALTSGVTFSAWVDTTSGYNAVMVAADSNNAHLGLYAGWTGLDASSAGKIAGGFHASSTWTDQYTYGTTDIDDGACRHLVMTYDAVRNEICLYVNGIQEASNVLGVTPVGFASAVPLYIGRYPLAGVEYFTGHSHDHRVYSRALPAAEASAMYNPSTRYDLYWRKSRSAPKYVAAAPASAKGHYYRNVLMARRRAS